MSSPLLAPSMRARFDCAVGPIPRSQFQRLCGFAVPDDNPILDEQGWFTDETVSFLGVVVRDKIDNDWGYVVLARDEYFHFRAIEQDTSLPARDGARAALQLRIADLLALPQRIYPQG